MNFKKIFKITEFEIQNSPILIKIANSIRTTGRIQDLSEGGARFISEQKSPDFGTKRPAAILFFDLKYSNRVKINDFSFP